jgi:PEP-CTERM motif
MKPTPLSPHSGSRMSILTGHHPKSKSLARIKIPLISTKAVAVGLVSSTALFSGMAEGAITLLNTASGATSTSAGPGSFAYDSTTKIYTLSYDAGATSDMLVLSVTVEKGSVGSFAISYGGSALTQAVTSGQNGASIWYLANPSATGSISIDAFTITTLNGFGIGIASLFGNGQEIGLTATGRSTNSTTVGITTVADSFVMVGADANNGINTTTPSMNAPLTQIYARGDVGSSKSAAGYENAVAAGAQTYGFTPGSAEERGLAAAAFTVIPEPSTALLGGLGLLALLRRRRN